MTLDAKTISAVVGLLSLLGGGVTWLYGEGVNKGKLEAKVELQAKYEGVINENLTYKFVCSCDTK